MLVDYFSSFTVSDGWERGKVLSVLYTIWDTINYKKPLESKMRTQTTIRVDKINYNLAKEILAKIGLNYSQAISVFNNMIVMHQGLPFDVKIPNKETQKALNELKMREGKSFKSVDDLFEDLDK